jgi:all-trans-retinol 13,14-reductase
MEARNAPEDVLVIGSGIGGLTAAILMAKLRHRVTVVEKNSLPGGLMRGYRRLGIDCPVGVHYMGSLAEGQLHRRLWDYLGITSMVPIERMGADGVIDRYIFDDFTFDLPEGIDAFEDNLRRSFPLEHNQITEFIRDLRQISDSLSSLEILTHPGPSILSPRLFESAGEHLVRAGCSTRLLSVLGVPPTMLGVDLPECPSYFYHMTLASYLLSSWRLSCSSSQMADAFASRLRSLGGDICTADGVEKILVESGQVKGAILESGRIIGAKIVIAAVHPKIVVSLLPEGAVRPSYAERITHLEDTKGLFAVTLVVDADAHGALPYNVYRLYPEENGAVNRGVFYQLRASGRHGMNILSIITKSGIEEWRQWISTVSGRRGHAYQEAKEEKARQLIGEAIKYFGQLKGMRILDAYTPLTIRDQVNSPGGSAYGVMRSTRQLMKSASLKRTSVRGLFLAGQSVLAPGIMGTMMGSFQTVKNIVGQERFNQELIGLFQ